MRRILSQGSLSFKLALNESQLSAFDTYCQELIAWNRKINLTRIVDPTDIAVKHFLDSLSVYLALSDLAPNISAIDVGTGAGFPGLPLKIALPEIQMVLLESNGKKSRFLRHVVGRLALEDVTVLKARAEEAGHEPEHREKYDVALARAVASMAVLAEYTLPLVKPGGRVVAQKGSDPWNELRLAEKALTTLGAEVDRIIPVEIAGLDAPRHLVVLMKKVATPCQYPRRPGRPAKHPL